MPELLTLELFHLPQERQYHIYKIGESQWGDAPHAHDFYHICYVSAGTVIHILDGDTATLRHGDAFLVPPGVVHSLSFPEQGSQVYSLSFSPGLFHAGFSKSHIYRFLTALELPGGEPQGLQGRVSLEAGQRLSMQALLDCLLRESETDYPKEQSAAASLITASLYLLAQAYGATPERQKRLQAAGQYADAMERCIQFVEKNYNRNLTAELLARQFAMSRTMFSQLFSQMAGAPLKKYITEKRIAQAALLMDTTQLPLCEISEIVGYEDFSTFYRNFVRRQGVSPSHYRVNGQA